MAARAPMLRTAQVVASTLTRTAATVDVRMDTTATTALKHSQLVRRITMVTVIIPVEDYATVLNLAIAMRVDFIPIQITGATVYVMMDMLDSIVLHIILMLTQLQLATIHVQVAALHHLLHVGSRK